MKTHNDQIWRFDYQQNRVSNRIVNAGDKPIRILVSPLESVVASFSKST
jgi:DNA-binding beta-propeller fold protein YncE